MSISFPRRTCVDCKYRSRVGGIWLLQSSLALLLLLAGRTAWAQGGEAFAALDPGGDDPPAAAISVNRPQPEEPAAAEVIPEVVRSYGNYAPFGTSFGVQLWTAGVEYDRHTWGHFSWGYFLGARVDYVMEALPVVLLRQAKTTTLWGTPLTSERETIPGIGISPIGWRLTWRSERRWKPYFIAKLGVLGFTHKVLSQDATYLNFFPQSGIGVQVAMSPRVDLRLGLFSYEHISNGDTVPVNPGVDLMTSSVGISYHLGRQGRGDVR